MRLSVRAVRCCGLALALSACSTGPAAEAVSVAPSPAHEGTRILREMVAHYASCRTYQDRGVSANVFREEDGSPPYTVRVTFETLFDRERGFRFEYRKEHEKFFPVETTVLWNDWHLGPSDAFIWESQSPDPASQRHMPLSTAAATLMGVSNGLSYIVPSKLFGTHATCNCVLDGEEDVKGKRAYRLRSVDPEDVRTVWIGRDDRAFLKIARRSLVRRDTTMSPSLPPQLREVLQEIRKNSGPFTTEQTIVFEPTFDQPVDASRFAFTPPAPPPRAASRRGPGFGLSR